MFFVLSSENSSMVNKILDENTCIVFYYWSLCGYCQQMKPVWDKIIKKFMNKKNLTIINVEISNLNLLKAKCRRNINGVPTIIKYANGKRVDEFKGRRELKELDDFVRK